MFRYAAIALTALLTYLFNPLQDFAPGLELMHIATAAAASRGAGVINTITVTNKTHRAIRRYPLQFGRPFVAGAIASGQCPVVAANGAALPTQADVKNRYPDGSAEFAVVAVVVPQIPANGSVELSLAPGICNNTPLTQAQMLDASYNFAATMTLVGGLPASGGKVQATRVISHWPAAPITNGGFTIAVNGTPTVITGINLVGASDVNAAMQKAIAAAIPGALFEGAGGGQGKAAIQAPPGVTLSYTTPPPRGQDMGAAYNFTQAAGAALTPPIAASPVTATADARTMLANGDYKLWTSGPVAQTIILADDTAARKYDIGFGPNGAQGGFHPFRPRFEATFWPQTHQVWVRAIGENGLSTELEDLHYALTITGANAKIYQNPGLAQPAMATWTKSFWLGGTPKAQINIDYNLAYLESTRWVPNYDPRLGLGEATIAADYAKWWVNTSHDLNGAGAWDPGMAGVGARGDIGPEPSWDAAWLYGGDWRLRQAALGNADLAAAWTVNLRESAPGYRLNRADPAGSSTGLGYPVADTDRPDLGPNGLEGGGEGDFLYYNSDLSPPPSDALKVVGSICLNQGAPCSGWDWASSHEPSPFFIPYVLTGDPFYLEELENWAAYDVFAGQRTQRGPTGVEGMADNELRGAGWMLRSRAEAAFAVPDGDPFKTYLSILTQEDIAAWEGALGVSDPVLGATAEYQWAKNVYGDPESQTNFGSPPPAPALGQWAAGLFNSNGSPGDIQGEMASANATAYTENFMNWYVVYSVGRAAELGFAARPLALYSGAYLTGLINSPYPQLIAAYFMPSMLTTGQIASFPALLASLATPWLTGVNYTGGQTQGALPQQFTTSLYSQGYDMYASAALASLVDEGAPGAALAEAWITAHVYQPLVASGSLRADPSWAIVPRTDHNTLPAQPTTPQ